MPFLRLVIVGLIGAVLSACASSGGVPRPFPGASLPPTAPAPPVAQLPPVPPLPSPPEAGPPALVPLPDMIITALSLRGTPYRFGGSDPSGFDCSGFVQWVFNSVGVALPREVREQYHIGEPIDLPEVQPGDLVFFETVSSGASHVGVAIGQSQFVHAPSSRGVVRVESYGATYWSTRFVGARRVTHTKVTKTN